MTLDNRLRPVIGAVSISPNGAVLGDIISCSETASDADDEPLSATYCHGRDQNGNSIGNSANILLDAAVVSGGTILTCVVTVEDLSGGMDIEDNSFYHRQHPSSCEQCDGKLGDCDNL